MRNFKISNEYRYFIIPLIMIFFTFGAIHSFEGRHKLQNALFPLICLWLWYQFFFIPHRVRIFENNTIEFKSILRKTILSPGDALTIKDGIQFVTISHKNGKIILSTLLDDYSSIIIFLNSQNPTMRKIDSGWNKKYERHPYYAIEQIGRKSPAIIALLTISYLIFYGLLLLGKTLYQILW